MRAEDRVVTSSLSRSIHIHGKHMTITVFKGILLDDDWLFEVADDEGYLDVSLMHTTRTETHLTQRSGLCVRRTNRT